MIVTKSAWDKFSSIVAVVGGPTENARARELFQRLTVVDDHPSEQTKRFLKSGPKIKQQHIDIFGSGASNLFGFQLILP